MDVLGYLVVKVSVDMFLSVDAFFFLGSKGSRGSTGKKLRSMHVWVFDNFLGSKGTKGDRGYYGSTGSSKLRVYNMVVLCACLIGSKGVKGDRGFYGFTGKLTCLVTQWTIHFYS